MSICLDELDKNPLYKMEFSPEQFQGGFFVGIKRTKEETVKFHAYISKLKITPEDLLKEVGCGLTMGQYLDFLYSERTGYASLLYKNINGESGQRTVALGKVKENVVVNEFIGCFSSMQTFFIPVRGTKFVNKIGYFYVDIDPRTLNMTKERAYALLKGLLKEEKIPIPTMIVDSGGGYYIIWKIESVPGGFKSVQNLFKRIEGFLVEQLSFIGSDEKVTDAARVLRIPGTINQKYNKEVRLLEFNPDKVYTMRFFQDFMNLTNGVDWEEQKKEWENNRKKRVEKRDVSQKQKQRSNKITHLFNLYTLSVSRVEDIRTFVHLDGYKLEGKRNETLFIYGVELMKINKNIHIVRQKVEELNDSLKKPLGISEIKEICSSVYKNYDIYKYKNSTIVDKLGITPDQQKHMKTLIEKHEKNRRDKEVKKKKRRNEDGLTARERAKLDLIGKVKELKTKGLKQAQIASELGIKQGTVSKYLKQ